MKTLSEILNLTAEYLKKKGIENSRYEAECILSEFLFTDRMGLYLNHAKPLQEHELSKIREALAERTSGKPLPYTLGAVYFFGNRFVIRPKVLIPRPDTEVLIEEVVNSLTAEKKKSDFAIGHLNQNQYNDEFRTPSESKELIEKINSDQIDSEIEIEREAFQENKTGENDNPIRKSILEIGSGTGVIPITIALMSENINFLSLDKNSDSIEISKENLESYKDKILKLNNTISFIQKDIFEFDNKGELFDIVVSNPPYVSINEYENLDNEIKFHEDHDALLAGEDGLDFYRFFRDNAANWLKPGGSLIFEHGNKQKNEILNLFEQNDQFSFVRAVKDLAGRDRVLNFKFLP